MCGIAGFVGKGIEDDARRMIEAVRHRGPDHQGFFARDGVGLANARLAIIDLTPDGNQPMWDTDGRVAVVFNGEIYNFQELRDEFGTGGRYQFRSKSDTEVILAAYRARGERCFETLNGMFAIALYDFEKKRLILARDRMGKKPLYYGVFAGTIVFGSELKAVLEHPAARRDIDPASLAQYLLYNYVPTPQAIFRGIRKLEPGTYRVWENGVKERRAGFWPAASPPASAPLFPDAVLRLEYLLDDAVRRRLIADVPLGVFLSGGIDSSAIAYFAARNMPAGRMKTFSIGFEDKTFDETSYAREAARYLGSDHTEYRVSARDMLEVVPRLPDIADEPLADSSLIPTAILCRLARKSVTVALSGDGGDELFAGYPTFLADRIAAVSDRLPRRLTDNVISKIAALLPARDTYMSVGFRVRKFLDGLSEDARYRHHRWLGSFSPEEAERILSPAALAAAGGAPLARRGFGGIDRILRELNAQGIEPGNRTLSLYQRTYLTDQVLVKVDRASMAYSLEVRSPFLDYRLVDFVNQLPYSYKCRGLTLKRILKKLMEGRIPPRIIHRRKKGFAAPVGRWLKNELRPLARETLLSTRVREDGFFDPRSVSTLLSNHLASRVDNSRKLWTLLQFQLWRERWLP